MGSMRDVPSGEAELREIIASLAERLAELEANPGPESQARPALEFTDGKLATIATSIYRARRRRAKLFNSALFSEPAWDMLLELFVGSVRGEVISSDRLCAAAQVQHATGMRWIAFLEEESLLRRRSVSRDGEVDLIEISDHGFDRMRQYILEGVTRFEMPMPD